MCRSFQKMSAPSESTDAAASSEGAAGCDQATSKRESDEVKPQQNGDIEPKPAAPPAKQKYRHDWYQTPTDVCVNVMIKGLKPKDVTVNYQEKMAS